MKTQLDKQYTAVSQASLSTPPQRSKLSAHGSNAHSSDTWGGWLLRGALGGLALCRLAGARSLPPLAAPASNATALVGAGMSSVPTLGAYDFALVAPDSNTTVAGLACDATGCEPVDVDLDTLRPPAEVLLGLRDAPALSGALRSVAEVTRYATRDASQGPLAEAVLDASCSADVLQTIVAPGQADALTSADLYAFTHAATLRIDPACTDPAAIFDVTRQSMQQMYGQSTFPAVQALTTLQQGGTLQVVMAPRNSTLAEQPIMDEVTTPPANATLRWVSPYEPQSPWVAVGAASEDAGVGGYMFALHGLLLGNTNSPLISDVPQLQHLDPALFAQAPELAGKNVPQIAMHCLQTIADIAHAAGINILPPDTVDDESGLFPAGASSFVGALGALHSGTGAMSLAHFLNDVVPAAMQSAGVSAADQATVNNRYAIMGALFDALSANTVNGRTLPPGQVTVQGNQLVLPNGDPWQDYGINMPDLKACGACPPIDSVGPGQSRDPWTVMAMTDFHLGNKNVGAIRYLFEADATGKTLPPTPSILQDEGYFQRQLRVLEHAGHRGAYVDASFWIDLGTAPDGIPTNATWPEAIKLGTAVRNMTHVSFSPCNEPELSSSANSTTLQSARDRMQGALSAFRSVAPNNLMWAQALIGWSDDGHYYLKAPINDSRVAYEVHLYSDSNDVANALEIGKTLPVGVLEFGVWPKAMTDQSMTTLVNYKQVMKFPAFSWSADFQDNCYEGMLVANALSQPGPGASGGAGACGVLTGQFTDNAWGQAFANLTRTGQWNGALNSGS